MAIDHTTGGKLVRTPYHLQGHFTCWIHAALDLRKQALFIYATGVNPNACVEQRIAIPALSYQGDSPRSIAIGLRLQRHDQ